MGLVFNFFLATCSIITRGYGTVLKLEVVRIGFGFAVHGKLGLRLSPLRTRSAEILCGAYSD